MTDPVVYVPTTILGLLGLISLYLYLYYKRKDDNKVRQIQAVRAGDRSKAIEMMLNDLGVSIDTSNLDAVQKYNLVLELMSSKTRKYLIISVTSIILAIIVAIVLMKDIFGPTRQGTIDAEKSDTSGSLQPIVRRTDSTEHTQRAHEDKKPGIEQVEPIKPVVDKARVVQGAYKLNYRGDFDFSSGSVNIYKIGKNKIRLEGTFTSYKSEQRVVNELFEGTRPSGLILDVFVIARYEGYFKATSHTLNLGDDDVTTIDVSGTYQSLDNKGRVQSTGNISTILLDYTQNVVKVLDVKGDVDASQIESSFWSK